MLELPLSPTIHWGFQPNHYPNTERNVVIKIILIANIQQISISSFVIYRSERLALPNPVRPQIAAINDKMGK